ncbi:MAG: tetratricopeptide repeat protein, partial [Candidatus Heimdallarchaeota archaeon]|nr:tetratricopeptide repeat protein [Candidatus Heimdallarchaeota archaeon]
MIEKGEYKTLIDEISTIAHISYFETIYLILGYYGMEDISTAKYNINAISHENKDDLASMVAYNYVKGLIALYNGKFNEVINILKDTEIILEKLSDYGEWEKEWIANIYNLASITYSRGLDLDLSEHYNNLARVLHNEVQNEYGLATAYLTLGTIYFRRGDRLLARKYYNESLNLYNKLESKDRIPLAYINIAMTYDGVTEYSTVLNLYETALLKCKNICFSKFISYIYNNLASLHSET